MRKLLARFGIRGELALQQVGQMSGGEKSKVALARLAAQDVNVLVLDEPTNHLDLAAREQLERVLDDYEGTIVAVSHDRYFIDRLASEIWDVRDGALKRYLGGWAAFEKARDEGRPLPDPETTALVMGRREAPRPQAPKPRKVAPAARPVPPAAPARRTSSSRVRKVEGVRALEARIAAMELQLTQLAKKLEDIAMSGDFMETRRLGAEHADLERSLRELYSEWTASAGPTEE
jgi:ATP-binding cassette subfamily F protein 3